MALRPCAAAGAGAAAAAVVTPVASGALLTSPVAGAPPPPPPPQAVRAAATAVADPDWRKRRRFMFVGSGKGYWLGGEPSSDRFRDALGGLSASRRSLEGCGWARRPQQEQRL